MSRRGSDVTVDNPGSSPPRMFPKLAPFSLKESSKHMKLFYSGDHMTGMGKCSLHTAYFIAPYIPACPTAICRPLYLNLNTGPKLGHHSPMARSASPEIKRYILEGSASYTKCRPTFVDKTIKIFSFPGNFIAMIRGQITAANESTNTQPRHVKRNNNTREKPSHPHRLLFLSPLVRNYPPKR